MKSADEKFRDVELGGIAIDDSYCTTGSSVVFFVGFVVATGAYPFASGCVVTGFVAETFALLWGRVAIFSSIAVGL